MENLIKQARNRGLVTGEAIILPNGICTSFTTTDKGLFIEDGILYWHSKLYTIRTKEGVWARLQHEPPQPLIKDNYEMY